MKELLLMLHLAGACVMAGLFIAAIFALITKKSKYYRILSQSIGVSAGVQILSGSFLATVTYGSLFLFCARIVIYVLVVLGVQILLLSAMNKEKIVFPIQLVVPSLSVGAISVIISAVIIILK